MVTCLYRVKTGRSVWSKLEALGVLADFMPGALAARFLERQVRFGLGSTMAIDRGALEGIGGLRPLCDYLADDYEIGSRICDSGRRVVMADTVVETSIPDYTWRDFWDHQLRWGRTVRSSRPGGYLGLVVTFGVFWGLLTLILSAATWWSVVLLTAVAIARIVTVESYGRALGDHSRKYLWLLPLRDLISPLVWLMSIGGTRIVWRGEEFRLTKGKLQRVAE
jgi:ceramide glucosyltransferase